MSKFSFFKILGLAIGVLFFSCNKNNDEILALLKEVKSQNESLRIQVNKLQQTADSVSNALKITNTNILNTDKKVDSIRTQLSSILVQINTLNLQMSQSNVNIIDIQKKITELQAKCTELYNLLLLHINATKIEIGDFLSGGIVFYIDSTGRHGLVSSVKDQVSSGSEFGCYCSPIIGTDTSVGKGFLNTNKIIEQCNQNIDYAAKVCDKLDLNGYTDWYLPSKNELMLMYTNLKLKNLGNFSTTVPYWSSTTSSFGSCGANGGAWTINFNNGTLISEYRSGYAGTGAVRAIRSF
jgi:hypothetical protein